jgi:hypothetical protein
VSPWFIYCFVNDGQAKFTSDRIGFGKRQGLPCLMCGAIASPINMFRLTCCPRRHNINCINMLDITNKHVINGSINKGPNELSGWFRAEGNNHLSKVAA